jgi:3-oxoacyl-[acyl-carrier protein] reductase
LALAREGVNITIVARNRDVLENTGGEIERLTGAAITIVAADLTTKDGRAAAISACPRPDILVNNSQGPPPGNFREWSREDWLAALDDMMLGPIEMMRRLLMVTLRATVCRASPAAKPTSPERAPFDNPSST